MGEGTYLTFPEFRKHDKYAGVEEGSYRQSRLCRLLGNLLTFAVVQLLAESGELGVGEIARAVGRSVQRVSSVLGVLRVAEVVRYQQDGRQNRYRLKHSSEIRGVLSALESGRTVDFGIAQLKIVWQ